ncbi:MAG: hypothetical protein IJ748_05840 [Bacteroidales bacterium]|nr:hypothetical protein [Bacteroidales bacterium]
MKKVLLVLFSAVLLLSSASIQSQNKTEVTKFLGIPIDGTKSAFEQKLKNKGFVYNASIEGYEGKFNGSNVYVGVATNKNKVYRVMVLDANPSNKTDIRIRFNKLCSQFLANEKYVPINDIGDYEIEDNEDISYNITVKNQRYEADFFQLSDEDLKFIKDNEIGVYTDSVYNRIKHRSVWFMIKEDAYNKYYIYMFYDNLLNAPNGEDL